MGHQTAINAVVGTSVKQLHLATTALLSGSTQETTDVLASGA
jgi:hypothetical protein